MLGYSNACVIQARLSRRSHLAARTGQGSLDTAQAWFDRKRQNNKPQVGMAPYRGAAPNEPQLTEVAHG